MGTAVCTLQFCTRSRIDSYHILFRMIGVSRLIVFQKFFSTLFHYNPRRCADRWYRSIGQAIGRGACSTDIHPVRIEMICTTENKKINKCPLTVVQVTWGVTFCKIPKD